MRTSQPWGRQLLNNSSVVSGPKHVYRICREDVTNFKSTTLAGSDDRKTNGRSGMHDELTANW